MKKVNLFFLFILINLKAISQEKLDYARTWVFMVGVLEWEDANTFASFEKKDRVDAKILNFFKEQGVPTKQMIYLKDQKASTNAVREAFVPFLKQAQKGDILFFYYCGHGYKNDQDKVCFANYKGSDWTAEEIVKTVHQNFAGNTAIFAADCCNSGGLANEVAKYPTRNYAALNSVIPTDVSTGNWTFSNALLYGLEGKNYVNTDNNSTIELDELAAYIDEEMAIVEGQKSAYFVPKNLKNWVLSQGVKAKSNSRIGERVTVNYDGTSYPGFIENVAPGNIFRVRFYSYINDEVDLVPASRVKPFTCKNDFPVGSNVKAYSKSYEKWYSAKVLKKFSCLHYIHYNGYGSEWDEWVSPENIK